MRAATLLALASLASAGGCAIIYGYSDYEEKPEEQMGPCESAADCPASDACITWSCVEGRCLGLATPAGTSCGAEDQCADGTMQPGEECDGKGVCVQPPSQPCGTGNCNGDVCSGCMEPSDCPTEQTCDNGLCNPCLTCGRALQDGGSGLPICPGSGAIAIALQECVCSDEHECAEVCNAASSCGGENEADWCVNCIFMNRLCDQEWEDCLTDDGHGEP